MLLARTFPSDSFRFHNRPEHVPQYHRWMSALPHDTTVARAACQCAKFRGRLTADVALALSHRS